MTRAAMRELALTAAVTAAASAVAAAMASALTTYLITRAAESQQQQATAAAFARQLVSSQAPLYEAWRRR